MKLQHAQTLLNARAGAFRHRDVRRIIGFALRRILGAIGHASCLIAVLTSAADAQPAVWQNRGIGGGGALYEPSFSPHHAGEIYLNCDMTQTFHSVDYGRSWTTLDFRGLTSNVTSAVAFTAHADTLYALRKDANSMRRPARSVDGGRSWQQLATDPANGSAFAIEADPHSTRRVLVGHASAIFFSTDAGSSYKTILSGAALSGGARIAGVFFAGDSCFLATASGVFLCTNVRAASPVFSALPVAGIPTSERLWAFAASRAGGMIRICCITFDSASVKTGNLPQRTYTGFRNVYTWDQGQPQWVSRTARLPAGSLPAFVDMCENDTGTVWLCGEGADQFGRRTFGVWKSSSGGAWWTSTLHTANNGNILTGWGGQNGDNGWGWWTCPNGFDLDPKNPAVAAFCDMGWIHVTTDAGATWVQAYTDSTVRHAAGTNTPTRQYYESAGLEPTAGYWLTWVDSVSMIAGFADIVALCSNDGGRRWSFDYSGLGIKGINDAAVILLHPGSGVLYAATGEVVGANGSYTDARASSPGRVCYSLDKGRTWQSLHDFGHTVHWITLDPARPDRMYACVVDVPGGAGGIYRSDDISRGAASQWSRLNAPPRTEGRPRELHVLRDGGLVAVYSARDAGNWQWTASSGVFFSSDEGLTWNDRTAAGMRYRVNSLTLDPSDTTQNTWLVFVGASSASGTPGVLRTVDRGVTWQRVSTQAAWSGTFDPVHPDRMYLCTDGNGLAILRDARTAAPTLQVDSLFPFRNPMRVFFHPNEPRQIWVMTFGNGMYMGYTDPVPVVLEYYTVSATGTRTRIEWRTASESGTCLFEVQCSDERMKTWNTLAVIHAAGSGAHTYVHETSSESDQHSCYRIRVVDCDGAEQYSPGLCVDVSRTGTTALHAALAPNPAHGRAVLTLDLPEAGQVVMEIWDAAGRAVGGRKDVYLQRGTSLLPIDCTTWIPGTYLIHITTHSETRRLVMSVF